MNKKEDYKWVYYSPKSGSVILRNTEAKGSVRLRFQEISEVWDHLDVLTMLHPYLRNARLVWVNTPFDWKSAAYRITKSLQLQYWDQEDKCWKGFLI